MPFPSFTKIYHNDSYPTISPTRPEVSAAGKIVLITGGGSGVGAATAKAFAQAKAKVVIITGRRVSFLEAAKKEVDALNTGSIVVRHTLDVSSAESVKNLFAAINEKYGPIDFVVNAAAHLSDQGTLKETSLSNFWTSFEINVKGAFLISHEFLNQKTSSTDRVLILCNSGLAHFPGSMLQTAPASYGMTKLAVAKMVEYIHAENVNDQTLRVYTVHPGVIPSAMSDKSIEMSPPGTREALTWDTAELPAHFFVWLASPEGRIIPSARYLWANWDVDELRQRRKELDDDPLLLTMTMKGWEPELINVSSFK